MPNIKYLNPGFLSHLFTILSHFTIHLQATLLKKQQTNNQKKIQENVFMLRALGIMRANGGYVMRTAFRRVHHAYCWVVFK